METELHKKQKQHRDIVRKQKTNSKTRKRQKKYRNSLK